MGKNFKRIKNRDLPDDHISITNPLGITNDKTFIKNLFIMSRSKRYEFKMLVKSLKLMNTGRISQVVKTYGISQGLVEKIMEAISQGTDLDTSTACLTEFITNLYESNKEAEKNPLD